MGVGGTKFIEVRRRGKRGQVRMGIGGLPNGSYKRFQLRRRRREAIKEVDLRNNGKGYYVI